MKTRKEDKEKRWILGGDNNIWGVPKITSCTSLEFKRRAWVEREVQGSQASAQPLKPWRWVKSCRSWGCKIGLEQNSRRHHVWVWKGRAALRRQTKKEQTGKRKESQEHALTQKPNTGFLSKKRVANKASFLILQYSFLLSYSPFPPSLPWERYPWDFGKERLSRPSGTGLALPHSVAQAASWAPAFLKS